MIEACNSIHNFGLIALSKRYLNSSISTADISLKGFSPHIFRSNHPSNAKREGVCLYYRENMVIKHRIDLQLLSECTVGESTRNRKKLYFIVLYRSPS